MILRCVMGTSLCLLAIGSSAALDLPHDCWMGIYSGDRKAGYCHTTVERTTFLGQPAYHWREQTEFRGQYRGCIVSATLSEDCYLDELFHPIVEITVSKSLHTCASDEDWSEDHTKTFVVRYAGRKIECRTEKDGAVELRSVPVPDGADFAALWRYTLGQREFSVGERVTGSVFSPDAQRVVNTGFTVVGRESVTIGDVTHDAFLISLRELDKAWVLPNGEEIKREDSFAREVYVRESREEATALPKDLPDFGLRVEPALPDPKEVRQLTIRIAGFPLPLQLIPDDSRQSIRVIDADTVEYRVVAALFEASNGLTLPITDSELSRYLEESPGIEVRDRAIGNLAREVIGNETNAYKAACKLRSWVRERIDESAEQEPADSALATLNSKSGGCRHKAALYTALARAAGIPTKLVAGFAYDDGYLEFHGWAESFVGQWVPLDPTLPTEFVDATHIKLKEGAGVAVVAPLVIDARPARAEVIHYSTAGDDPPESESGTANP